MVYLRTFFFLTPVLFLLFLQCSLCENEIIPETHVSLDKAKFELSPDELSLLDVLGSLVGLSGGEVSTILSLTKLGLGVIEGLEKIFVKVFNGTSLDFSFLDRPSADKELLNMFEIITLRLDQIQRGVDGTEYSLRALASGLPYLVRWEIALDTIEDYIKPINNLFHRFAYYQKHKLEVEDHTIMDFAQNVVSHSTHSIQALMANIHSMAAPSDPPTLRGNPTFERDEYQIDERVTTQMSVHLRRLISSNPEKKLSSKKKLQDFTLRPSIFRMLEDALEKYDSCNYKVSPQQLVLGLYTVLALTLARGYSMIAFSYSILKFHNEGNFTIERQLSDELYAHYSRGLLRNALSVVERVSNGYKRCDPSEYVEGQTFVMVTELLQGYIENEVDMNSRGTCGNKCSSYEHAKVEGCYLPDTQYCGKHRRCKGQVHNCRYFDADADVCISSVPHRRYDWIKYEDRRTLGTVDSCNNLTKVDSWWRFFYHCSYCMCLCDDSSSTTSDRYISLQPVVSDIANGMVVTGLRFTKVNKVIHLQVQEGKAMPQGQVNPDTIQWRDVDPISVGTSKFVENEDYMTFRYEARSIDLDHLKAPKDYVVTGVKFRTWGTHANLEMWVTPINFTSGEMQTQMSYWISNDNTPVMARNPRQKIKLIDPDDPRKMKSQSIVESRSDTYIQLQETSMTTDVSQLTVPFFDAQPVAPNPATWLEGVQMYHRGRPGFGGFIGFKVFNYNLKRHFEQEIEKEFSL